MTARSQITNAAIEAGLKRTPQQRAEESEPAWRPIQDAPATPGTYINVRSVTTYRWLAYKPDRVRQMRKAGRWQIATEHGWENAELPERAEFVLNSPLAKASGE
jgi:hypothetical protein